MNDQNTRELSEAWHLLNVLSANLMDDGPTWPRVLEWLSRNESFRPENAAANLLAKAPSPDRNCNEPLRQAYSREELRDCVTRWLCEQYGRPIDLEEQAKDRWHERCGLIYSFIFDHFPSEERRTTQTQKNENAKRN